MTTESQTSIRQAMERALDARKISDDVAGYVIDGAFPKVIVFPESVEELSRVMASAFEHSIAVAPWGGGTRMELGNEIRYLDVVVDLSRLNKVVQHNSADLTVTVEAGITLSILRELLSEKGQFLALDPPLPDKATIGGTLAAGVSGPLKWQHGSARDLVIGMKVVQTDGRLVKSGGQVVKNVSGYDMARLHVGGLGTLGVIAEVSFKLTPLPRSEATVLAAFDSLDDAANAALSIFNSYATPLALTLLDGGVNRRTEVCRGRFQTCPYALAIRLGGRPRTLERQVNDAVSLCQERGAMDIEKVEGSQAEELWRKLSDFGWDGATPSMSARISALPTDVTKVFRALERNDGLDVAIVAHPGYGTVYAHWFAVGDLSSDMSGDVLEEARSAIHDAGGSMTIERCPLEVKRRLDVWDEIGGPIAIMRRMKEQYDPKGILNPGRYAGGI